MICEGFYDAVFFHEGLKIFGSLDTYLIPDNQMQKLQGVYGNYHFMRERIRSTIYGDGGRPTVFDWVLRRVISTLRSMPENVDLIIVVDDDGSSYEELSTLTQTKIREILDDNAIFQNPPIANYSRDSITITNQRSGQITKVNLCIVPQSLEIQVRNKAFEQSKYRFTKSEIEGLMADDPHRALKCIASKYHKDNEEILIRSAAEWFEEEKWFGDIINMFIV
jgi:hypothetical protein